MEGPYICTGRVDGSLAVWVIQQQLRVHNTANISLNNSLLDLNMGECVVPVNSVILVYK